MKRTTWIALGLLTFVGGAARADEKATSVRTTATVEVIDDARQVDDIIARVKAQKSDAQANATSGKAKVQGKLDRLPLPPARDRDEAGHDKQNRQSDRHDRDRSGLHRQHR